MEICFADFGEEPDSGVDVDHEEEERKERERVAKYGTRDAADLWEEEQNTISRR